MMAIFFGLLLAFRFSVTLAFANITLPPDPELFPRVEAKLSGQTDKVERTIRRMGKKTIEFEAFIAADGDVKLAPKIFGEFATYSNWALRNINIKPSTGERYYFQILNLMARQEDKMILTGSFFFNLPLYKKQVERSFRMSFSPAPIGFAVSGETLTDDDSPIAGAGAILRAYPAVGLPNTLWFYVKAVAVFRNWLLYEALPERLLAKETAERIQIILDNYAAEEDRVRLVHTAKTKAPSRP